MIPTRNLRIRATETYACVFVARVCVAVQDAQLAGEPTNHPSVSLRDLYFASKRKIYLFTNLGVEFRAIPSIHPSIHQTTQIIIFFKQVADIRSYRYTCVYRQACLSRRSQALHVSSGASGHRQSLTVPKTHVDFGCLFLTFQEHSFVFFPNKALP